MLITPTIARSGRRRSESSRELAQPDHGEDDEIRIEQRADIGGDVADPDPGRLELLRVVQLGLRPLRADPHQDVGGEDADQQRLQAEAGQAGRVVRRSPAEHGGEADCRAGCRRAASRRARAGSSGRLTESARIAASISGSGLPDHEDEDDEHGDAVDRLEADPGFTAARPALERLAGLAARPAADRPEHERGEDPAVPELVGRRRRSRARSRR